MVKRLRPRRSKATAHCKRTSGRKTVDDAENPTCTAIHSSELSEEGMPSVDEAHLTTNSKRKLRKITDNSCLGDLNVTDESKDDDQSDEGGEAGSEISVYSANDDQSEIEKSDVDMDSHSEDSKSDETEDKEEEPENENLAEEDPDAESESGHGDASFDQPEPTYLGSKKKHTPGIVYLSYIPDRLTVAMTRELLSPFGKVGRIYFEPMKRLNKRTRPNHRFAEGWVEFEKKAVAKKVAEMLNLKPVGGKRHAPYYDALWSIKYLHRFRWPHLTERLAYEKAVKDQRLRTEIAQAKREASYYAKALERSIRLRKQRKQQVKDAGGEDSTHTGHNNLRLRKTDREIRLEKNEGSLVDRKLLMSIFSK
ncbi:pre-rRNA-processing protein ESF2-like [Tropilaelaps mercedesae]|uniref:Activator of basal transcription 1 n=1 Tax=Tropilaelaps mercedesae TaxID=418985 RepID=A0A1V9XF64_9ACAR|nr:pre-rRNA-processing protein ESF2-like [Tropilaelaps mercedesae]